MTRRLLLFLSLLSGLTVSAAPWRLGYVNSDLLAASAVPWSYYTHVAVLGLNCNTSTSQLYNQYGYSTTAWAQYRTSATANGVKLLILIGGDMTNCTNSGNIAAFANSIVTAVNGTNASLNPSNVVFDGVTLDWESGISTGSSAAYESLISRLRTAWGSGKLISLDGWRDAAFGNVIVNQAANLDMFLNEMYDIPLTGPQNPSGQEWSWYNMALTSPTLNSGSAEGSANWYVGLGFPMTKIAEGIPLYGYLYSGCTKGEVVGCTSSSTQYSYKTIRNNSTWWGAPHSYDSAVGADYLPLSGSNQYVTYSDTDQIANLITWGKSVSLGGYFVWSLELENLGLGTQALSYPLSNAIFTNSAGSCTISTTSLPSGTLGTAYSQTLASSGCTGNWSITSGSLPPPLTLTAATGLISGTPNTAGTYNFTVAIGTATQPLTLVISPACTILTTSLPNGQDGVPYSATLQSQFCTGNWTITPNPPSGTTLNAATGVISGIPTGLGVASFTASIGTASKPLTITIIAACAINTTSLPNGTVGVPYSQTLTATNCSGPWSLIAGSLPPPLTLTGASGVIAGTPNNAATYSFTVQIGTSSIATQALSITIANVPCSISTTSLPVATIGYTYSQTVVQVGCAGNWSITGGTLPTGIGLTATSGLLSGNPTTAGLYSFTLTVGTAAKALTIVVATPCVIPATNCTATAGATVTLIAPAPATFTLLNHSVGTLNVVDSTHATYTAPATIDEANSTVGGCLVMPNDAVYNTRIDALPTAANSATWMTEWRTVETTIGWNGSFDPDVIDNTANTIASPQFFYTPNYTSPFQIPTNIDRMRENGSIANGTIGYTANGDHHEVAINHQTCQIYEAYQDQIPIAGYARGKVNGQPCQNGVSNAGCDAQSGWQYSGNGYAVPTNGATGAASEPLLVMHWRAPEIRAGSIKHAMRLTLPQGMCGTGFVWPATGTTCGGAANAPPLGTRFRLKAGATCPQSTATALTICAALKQYGFILDDITQGSADFIASTDMGYDPVVKQVFVGNINFPIDSSANSFEAVDESSLELTASTYAVNPNNTYVIPSNSAVVQYGTGTYQPVALLPVTVGSTLPYLALLSGSSFTPTVWVNGSSNTAVTWTATGGGTFAGGVYTPPTVAIGGNTAVTLTACSVADPASCTTLYANVLPSKCQSADTTTRICIDSGAIVPFGPDTHGDTYSADAVATGGAESYSIQTAGWQFVTDGVPYETGLGNVDITYHLANMPNGNYKVTYLQGYGYNGQGGSQCNFNNGWPSTYYVSGGTSSGGFNLRPWPGTPGIPMILGAQNIVTNRIYDPGLAYPVNNGYLCFQPGTVTIPAQVTNGALTTGLYSYWDQYSQYYPTLEALRIEQDITPAHVAIDLATQSPILAPGSTLQLQPQFWYTAVTSVTWSIVPNPDGVTGPGSINSATGLYTAPGSVTLTRPTTIQLTDTNSHTATLVLTVEGTQHPALVD